MLHHIFAGCLTGLYNFNIGVSEGVSCINIHAKRICFLRIDFDFCFLERRMWVEGRGTRCGKFSLISTI